MAHRHSRSTNWYIERAETCADQFLAAGNEEEARKHRMIAVGAGLTQLAGRLMHRDTLSGLFRYMDVHDTPELHHVYRLYDGLKQVTNRTWGGSVYLIGLSNSPDTIAYHLAYIPGLWLKHRRALRVTQTRSGYEASLGTPGFRTLVQDNMKHPEGDVLKAHIAVNPKGSRADKLKFDPTITWHVTSAAVQTLETKVKADSLCTPAAEAVIAAMTKTIGCAATQGAWNHYAAESCS